MKQPPSPNQEEDVRRAVEVDAEPVGTAFRGTRPERTPVTRPGPARLAAAVNDAINHEKATKQPLSSHKGEGARCSAEDTAPTVEGRLERDPGERLGKLHPGLLCLSRRACAPTEAAGACGTRTVRPQGTQPGPARPAAGVADETYAG